VDLGVFAPGPVRVRFRMLADDFLGADGWHVDHVRIERPAPATGVPVAATLPSPVARPNPARGEVRLAVALATPAELEWSLFDPQGRRVSVLWRGRVGAGDRDLGARLPASLPPGLYFSRIAIDGRLRATSRLAVVR
jgi:hypothetical protein